MKPSWKTKNRNNRKNLLLLHNFKSQRDKLWEFCKQQGKADGEIFQIERRKEAAANKAAVLWNVFWWVTACTAILKSRACLWASQTTHSVVTESLNFKPPATQAFAQQVKHLFINLFDRCAGSASNLRHAALIYSVQLQPYQKSKGFTEINFPSVIVDEFWFWMLNKDMVIHSSCFSAASLFTGSSKPIN